MGSWACGGQLWWSNGEAAEGAGPTCGAGLTPPLKQKRNTNMEERAALGALSRTNKNTKTIEKRKMNGECLSKIGEGYCCTNVLAAGQYHGTACSLVPA